MRFSRPINSIPTNALRISRSKNADRFPKIFAQGMGHHVFGCDICQDVCPWNRKAPASTAPEFEPGRAW